MLRDRNPTKRGWFNTAFQTVSTHSEGGDGDRFAASVTVHDRVQWSCKRQPTVDPSGSDKWPWWQPVCWRFQSCPTHHSRGKCLHSAAAQVIFNMFPRTNLQSEICLNSIYKCRCHRKHWIVVRKTMMFMATSVVYSKHHMKPISMLCGQIVELFVHFKLDHMKSTTIL
jgi:hypothetical protein